MVRALLAGFAFILLLAAPSHALDGRQTLGFGRIFNNDALGDYRDRWRTGSYAVSWVRGPGWDGVLPTRPFQIVEYRFRAEIIAPANLLFPSPFDRRYAGVLSFGAHTHFRTGRTDFSVGADLVVTGPQTGLGDFQRAVHEILDGPIPSFVLTTQIPNAVHPTMTFSATRQVPLGRMLEFRPFVEAQAGVETLVRMGGDLTVGRVFQGDMVLRDVVTGQRYEAVQGGNTGFGFIVGGDVAYVAQSAYFPSFGAAQVEPVRSRLRAGLMWRTEKSTLFYGISYLGKEFRSQPNGQFVGSLGLRIRF